MRYLALMPLLFALTLPVKADFYEGLRAYERGDHATALKLWRSLAIQGNASAQYDLGAGLSSR